MLPWPFCRQRMLTAVDRPCITAEGHVHMLFLALGRPGVVFIRAERLQFACPRFAAFQLSWITGEGDVLPA